VGVRPHWSLGLGGKSWPRNSQVGPWQASEGQKEKSSEVKPGRKQTQEATGAVSQPSRMSSLILPGTLLELFSGPMRSAGSPYWS
jgi:hypothetical protein